MRNFISMNLRQLYNLCEFDVKTRANRVTLYVIKPSTTDKKILTHPRFQFLARSPEVYSLRTGHIASIVFPNIERDLNKIDNQQKPMTEEVRLHCTCPAFLYWGSDWLSGQNRYNLEPATRIPPNIRDPQRKHYLCKHLIKVCSYMSGANFKFLFDRFKYSSRVRMGAEELHVLEPKECFDSYIQALKDMGEYSKDKENLIFKYIDSPELDKVLIDLGIYVSEE